MSDENVKFVIDPEEFRLARNGLIRAGAPLQAPILLLDALDMARQRAHHCGWCECRLQLYTINRPVEEGDPVVQLNVYRNDEGQPARTFTVNITSSDAKILGFF